VKGDEANLEKKKGGVFCLSGEQERAFTTKGKGGKCKKGEPTRMKAGVGGKEGQIARGGKGGL